MHSEYKGSHNGNRTLVIHAMHVELLQNGTQLYDLQFQWLYNRRVLLATTTVTILLMSPQGMQWLQKIVDNKRVWVVGL